MHAVYVFMYDAAYLPGYDIYVGERYEGFSGEAAVQRGSP